MNPTVIETQEEKTGGAWFGTIGYEAYMVWVLQESLTRPFPAPKKEELE